MPLYLVFMSRMSCSTRERTAVSTSVDMATRVGTEEPGVTSPCSSVCRITCDAFMRTTSLKQIGDKLENRWDRSFY